MFGEVALPVAGVGVGGAPEVRDSRREGGFGVAVDIDGFFTFFIGGSGSGASEGGMSRSPLLKYACRFCPATETACSRPLNLIEFSTIVLKSSRNALTVEY